MANTPPEVDNVNHRWESLWLAWKPRVPRWLPDRGPAIADPTIGHASVVDYEAVALLVHIVVGIQWVIVVLIAPVVLLVRFLRRFREKVGCPTPRGQVQQRSAATDRTEPDYDGPQQTD
jgi:hypothetical protein